MKKYCIVLASGVGSRFGADCPKQFVKVAGKMLIEHTLDACDCGVFDELILVVSSLYVDEMISVVDSGNYSVPIKVIPGGATREESCKNGADAIVDDEGLVVVHNGAQPFVKRETFVACCASLEKYSAVVSGIPCTYTIMEVDGANVVKNVPDRSRLAVDMGEEGFRLSLLRRALQLSAEIVPCANIVGRVVKAHLCDVGVFAGDPGNVKITYADDMIYVAERLSKRKKV